MEHGEKHPGLAPQHNGGHPSFAATQGIAPLYHTQGLQLQSPHISAKMAKSPGRTPLHGPSFARDSLPIFCPPTCPKGPTQLLPAPPLPISQTGLVRLERPCIYPIRTPSTNRLPGSPRPSLRWSGRCLQLRLRRFLDFDHPRRFTAAPRLPSILSG